jgi:PPK2 family polyphosphate:nucleotide phosphotransferase
MLISIIRRKIVDSYRVQSKKKIHLEEVDPNDTSLFSGSKKEGLAKLADLSKKLDHLQEVLYAEHKHRLLVVIQAMDTAGKDGTIRSVFDGVNPQGVRVASFKTPTPEELDHDYLWRIHKQTPAKGEIVIFNRSHYEDVLVVRVHNLAPQSIWEKRFNQINQFERQLAREGTTIVKFFLHIDLEEQKQRLLDRIQDPTKQWKFNPGDLDERKLWPQYMQAYEDVLNKTSTSWAPWYIIPANRNWYRNLMVSSILVETLQKMKLSYPKPVENIGSYAAQLTGEAQAEEQ